MERESILELGSPNGNSTAIVELDGASCYLYLYEAEPLSIRSCWVRNLRTAPERLDVEAMQNGEPPMLPRANCRHPEGAPPPRPEHLRGVWSESGDAVALYEKEHLLAVIPSWSGTNGFPGYARDCIGESPLCWELGTPKTNAQFQVFRMAAEYWAAWDRPPGPWPGFQSKMMDAYYSQLGAHTRYYAIDGGMWPPKAMIRMDQTDKVVLVSLGVGIRSQPRVETHFERPDDHRRIELGVCLATPIAEKAVTRIGEYVSGQSSLPWTQRTFLDDGHTIPSDVFSELSGGRFSSVLLQVAPFGGPTVKLPRFRNDPVRLLWMIPITENERQLAINSGSGVLAASLRRAHGGWKHKFDRATVA